MAELANMEAGQAIIATATDKQPLLVHQMRQAALQDQLAHAYLFVGARGRGQVELATWLAMRLLCPNISASGDPDGTCDQCRRIADHEHPDVIEIVPDGNSIKVDQIRFLRDEFTKTAVEGQRKIFIIQAADTMTNSATNSLLKFIEEPQGQQTAILIAENRSQILPTIISRTQVVDFAATDEAEFKTVLTQLGYDEQHAQLVEQLTDNLAQAEEWLVDDWFSQITQCVVTLVDGLIAHRDDVFAFVQTDVMALINGREQQEAFLALLAQAWRDIVLLRTTNAAQCHFEQAPTWEQNLQRIPIATLVRILDQNLAAPQRLASNIAFQTTLEALLLETRLELAGK